MKKIGLFLILFLLAMGNESFAAYRPYEESTELRKATMLPETKKVPQFATPSTNVVAPRAGAIKIVPTIKATDGLKPPMISGGIKGITGVAPKLSEVKIARGLKLATAAVVERPIVEGVRITPGVAVNYKTRPGAVGVGIMTPIGDMVRSAAPAKAIHDLKPAITGRGAGIVDAVKMNAGIAISGSRVATPGIMTPITDVAKITTRTTVTPGIVAPIGGGIKTNPTIAAPTRSQPTVTSGITKLPETKPIWRK